MKIEPGIEYKIGKHLNGEMFQVCSKKCKYAINDYGCVNPKIIARHKGFESLPCEFAIIDCFEIYDSKITEE